MDYWYMVMAIVAGSVLSLLGGATIFLTKKKRAHAITIALPFGAGALLAAAFLDLLPEAVEGAEQALVYALGGFLLFFVLERVLGWFHHHHHHGNEQEKRNKTHVNLVIIGDTIHNAIDGVAIGAAFLVSVPTGIITALAVAAHEIPQEIGDFGILLGKGMRPRRVVLVNLLSSLATVALALVTFWLGGSNALPIAPILALVAGMFIYIAASDIIPDIHEKPHATALRQSLMLLLGVVVVAVAVNLL